MDYEYDIILKNGLVVDYVTNLNEIKDIGIKDGKIAKIDDNISTTTAEDSFDLGGYIVVPGIIESHMHGSKRSGGRYSQKMLALAGVTTALDMTGPIDGVLEIVRDDGVGLNIACIEYVRPGYTVKTDNPSDEELDEYIKSSLERGSVGIKILGGHYPLTSDATRRTIRVANENKAYVAFHAGTQTHGSNINGALEAIELAEGNALHLAHINAYCRGTVREHMIETEEVIEALKKNPKIRSESYISPLNGTSGKCTDGLPESLVTRRCLQTGGFEPTEEGLEKAILAGWAQVNMESGGKVGLGVGKEGAEYWRSRGTAAGLSFAVNPKEPRYRLAVAKKDDGEFVVDCISTDGGGIPRNVIVEMGLSLVKLDAISMLEFVKKTSANPAKLLGLTNKGHLSIGADADITVIDFDKQKAHMSIVNGKVIMIDGYVCGNSGQIITTAKGEKAIREFGLEPIVVDIAKSGFYNW